MAFNATGQAQSQFLKAATHATGLAYLEAITNVFADQDVADKLNDVVKGLKADSVDVRQARILLARLHYPDVFVEYDAFVKKWRKDFPHGERSGFLAGTILNFTKKGPENKYVDEKSGRKTWEVVGAVTNKVILGDAVYKKVERFTAAEVQAGIARNAAARQAVLEHFLKFLDDGDAYEQSEIVDVVNRLWGRDRIKRNGDLAVIDNVPDAEALIEAVFKDGSRPEDVRQRAAFCLPDSKQPEIRAFMMSVVTNTPSSYSQKADTVRRALAYLESSTDAAELAVFKGQTNAPAWKRDIMMNTIRAVEARLSAASHGK